MNNLVALLSSLPFITLHMCEPSCPPNIAELAPNVCLFRNGSVRSYCEAHKVCADYHELHGVHAFLIGKDTNYIEKFDRASIPDIETFTSINSLYRTRPHTGEAWRVGDPREANFTTSGMEFSWNKTGGSESRIVVYWHQKLVAVPQRDQMGVAMCQFSPSVHNFSAVEQFRKNWPPQGEIVTEGDSANGCWEVKTVHSKIQCAFSCKIHHYCRSFYYNEKTKECKQSIYVDSSLFVQDINSAGEWVRFGRPFWGF
ncbi:hypothetical protein T265_10008 [Opisthorchis viverrini]|uniref:Apple domain-containing protein n=1 Tax=Opisthorchis viverrini TaxID=6198 RepID=A0A075A2X4_OPIVI|nr:hypothetical protein T265_10008 [Opisthorchis viverrini]KER21729.1 hypothetical protein T265_10008 [Opisthorchis viverrini]